MQAEVGLELHRAQPGARTGHLQTKPGAKRGRVDHRDLKLHLLVCAAKFCAGAGHADRAGAQVGNMQMFSWQGLDMVKRDKSNPRGAVQPNVALGLDMQRDLAREWVACTT